MRAKRIIPFLVGVFAAITASAQVEDLELEIGQQSAFSSTDYLPFYAVTNRFGQLEEGRQHDVAYNLRLESGVSTLRWKFKYGLEGIGRTPVKDSYLHQAYFQTDYRSLRLQIGKKERFIGSESPADLGTGEIGISRNARIIPEVRLSMPDFEWIPLTKRRVRITGGISHGWMENSRLVEGALLHRKWVEFKFGKKHSKLHIQTGLTHYAIWGGYHPNADVQLPEEFQDFLRVATGRSARDVEGAQQYGGEVINSLGSHFAVIRLGGSLYNKHGDFFFYHYSPIEDKTGLNLIKNRDRHVFLSWRVHNWNAKIKRHLATVTAEYLTTVWQSGPGTPDFVPGQSNFGYNFGGRDDYYNNYWYQDGWTYHDRVIGNPLFMTRDRALQYFDDIEDYGVYIVSNRLRAMHLGMGGWLAGSFRWKARLTHSINYGTYAGENGGRYEWGSRDPDFDNSNYPFLDPLHQFYGSISATWQPPKSEGWQVTGEIPFEVGSLSDAVGMVVAIRWTGQFRTKK